MRVCGKVGWMVRRGARCGLVWLGVLAGGVFVQAQTTPLPEAPAAGAIRGSVTDADGARVRGAAVAAEVQGRVAARATTDDAGEYVLRSLPEGSVIVVAAAAGLASFQTTFTLAAGEQLEAPPIVLGVVAEETVTVGALTRVEVATAEVHSEERQRVLGIIPNFNVVYAEHPVPLNAKQKLALTSHELFDYTTFVFAGVGAGILQAANIYPGYGSDAASFGKRYGAVLAGGASDSLLTHGLFPILFRQDPRYYFKQDGTVWQRTEYALATSVVRRGDNGRWQPNYMTFAGGLSAGAISQLYLPKGSRAASSAVVAGAALGLAASGFSHLLQQFVFQHITTESRQNSEKP